MDGIKLMLSRRLLLLLAMTSFGVLGMSGTALAGTTFTVTDTGDYAQQAPNSSPSNSNWGKCSSTDNGQCTLRAAVEAADELGGPSTINLPAGMIKFTIPASSTANTPWPAANKDPSQGDLDVNPLDNSTTITINGAGSGSTIINANGVDRAFSVEANTTVGGLTLSGLTIENGSPSSNSYDGSSYAGAIYSDGALAISKDVTFLSNGAGYYGGAIYADSGSGSTVSITGANFTGNDTDDYAGAIYDDSPNTITLSKTLFDNNVTADYGGAIAVEGTGGMTIDGTTFNLNTTEDYGGAIYWASSTGGALTVTNSTFENNNGPYIGGAVLDYGSSGMSFSNTRFVGNSSGYGDGGSALYMDSNYSTSTPQYTLNQDQVDNNSSGYYGPLTWYRGNLDIHGTSFIHNDGNYDGGAIFADCGSCSLTLVNSTIARNTAEYGGGIYFDTTTEVAMTNDTIAFNNAPGDGGSSNGGGGVAYADYAATSSYTPPAGDTSEASGVENVVIGQNNGGDCYAGHPFSGVEPNGHNMDSDKSCFGSSGAPGDQAGVATNLAQPANNGGPLVGDPATGQTTPLTISDQSSPAVDAGTNTGCPATDERGVTRDNDPCDIGAFEAVAAALAIKNSAPASAGSGAAFNDTIIVANNGPGYSTGTTLNAVIPSGETLYAASPSQGSCSTSGSSVTCSLGNLASGTAATVTLTLSAVNTVTNSATATNDQGASVGATATTTVAPPAKPPAKPSAKPPAKKVTGSLRLVGRKLHVTGGKRPHVTVTFRCASNATCFGKFSITYHVKAKNGKTVTAVCTKSRFDFFRIPAGRTMTIDRPVHGACVTSIKNSKGKLAAKLTSHPRSGQQGVVAGVTLLL